MPPGFDRLEFADSVVVLNRAHGVWLRDLAERFEIVWASTWAASANELIGLIDAGESASAVAEHLGHADPASRCGSTPTSSRAARTEHAERSMACL